MKSIKTFQDACKAEGLDPKKVIPDFSLFPEKSRKAMIAHAKLIIIVMAVNRLANNGKEWIPDWNNTSGYKWYPWFYMGGSSGFRFGGCDNWLTVSAVGSRLCFISEEVGTKTVKQFIDLYKEYYTM